MKRWLLILLIALLPVQFSWAAVGAYCGDEHEASEDHAFHGNKAGPSAQTSDGTHGPDVDADRSLDIECGKHCHGHLTSMPAGTPDEEVEARQSPLIGDHAVLALRQPEVRPERPQWPTLA